ncbi:hypothetical protein AIOL_000264 [Candidatus Rhodobacter oscarellae]|uniref:RDD domain-containing protein n=1 Tax=Candidatus Rhodobacter oscarellae TaxID=1675527 RepID=A0A0J9EBI8_9RHOB|nr:RDD family protein [Candidatus Rhodobacter lobularis]KMW60112.1 hypothetical protein AIOL_000264 [Candidatus Rhodobacter lobularis]
MRSPAADVRKAQRLARKDRRAERGRAASTILPPEGVPLNLPVASIGVRLAAQIADVLITTVAAVCLVILFSALELTRPQTIMAIAMLLFFVIRVPYYILSELAWNGQTLGKRFLKIKVVAHNGGSLSTHALVLRNLMKEAEIFLPGTLLLTLDQESPVASWIALAWVAMAFAIPLMNPYRQRLGDILAGTHVIHLPQPILLKDLAGEAKPMTAAKPGAKGFAFLAHQLDHYGAFELQTLETLLRAQDKFMSPDVHARNRRTVATIVEKIRQKIGFADPIPPARAVEFLRSFYNAQRAHLEQRQLFGDKRADKHHAADETPQ